MTPPELPPVLPGFSEPIYGFLKPWAKSSQDIEDVRCLVQGEWVRSGWAKGDRIGYWSLRLGSPIALANGITPANGLAGSEPDIRPELRKDIEQLVETRKDSIEGTRRYFRGDAPEQAAKPDEGARPSIKGAEFRLKWEGVGFYRCDIQLPDGVEVVTAEIARGVESKLKSDLAAARADNENLRTESEKWRTKFLIQRDEAKGDIWVWMGDGNDCPESLACPVIMSADELREFVAAKESVERLRAALEWQPIETAPKDGTAILIYLKGYEPTVVTWHPSKDERFSCWQLVECGSYAGDGDTYAPTHWRPLPAAPEAKQGEGRAGA